MSVHLITGYAGKEHITSADQGSFNAAIMGGGEFVMERGEQFRCQVISNNQVRIYDGDALMQGRHILIDRNTYVETTHDNGTQGYKRIDLIVLTYEKNAVTSIETVKLEVIKGTPAESNPSVPGYTTGDILNSGEAKNQMPLYKIPFDGLSIGEPVKLFSTVPTLETMKTEVDEKVDDKIEELDETFSVLEGSIDEKIANAGKPVSSSANDWALIENYGEYSADAKTAGEEVARLTKLISGKVDKVSGKGLSTNDYTTAEKDKLSGIATGANKTTVDSALSTSSTNPVQNKAVTAKINTINTNINTINNSLGGLRFGIDGEGNYGYFGADGSLIPFKSGFDEAEVYHGLTSYTFTSDYKVVYAISHRGNTTVPDMFLNNVKQEYVSSIRGNSTASGTCLFHDIVSGDIVSTTGAVTVICYK